MFPCNSYLRQLQRVSRQLQIDTNVGDLREEILNAKILNLVCNVGELFKHWYYLHLLSLLQQFICCSMDRMNLRTGSRRGRKKIFGERETE